MLDRENGIYYLFIMVALAVFNLTISNLCYP